MSFATFAALASLGLSVTAATAEDASVQDRWICGVLASVAAGVLIGRTVA